MLFWRISHFNADIEIYCYLRAESQGILLQQYGRHGGLSTGQSCGASTMLTAAQARLVKV